MGHSDWVRSLGLDTDGDLFVEIINGIRLYDLCLKNRLSSAKTILPQDLMRVVNRQLYFRFLATLKEIESILIHPMYDGNHTIKRGDIVVDAGARIGTFTAKASAAVGEEGKIIAIEPEPHCFACLQKNIAENKMKNVVAIQKALWSSAKPLDLFLSENTASHSAYYDAFYSPTGQTIPVEADTLDNILEELGISSVDFMKMDIEGSEIEALRGMRKALESLGRLAIAAYHPMDGKLTHTLIVPQLEQLGFKTAYVEGVLQAYR